MISAIFYTIIYLFFYKGTANPGWFTCDEKNYNAIILKLIGYQMFVSRNANGARYVEVSSESNSNLL